MSPREPSPSAPRDAGAAHRVAAAGPRDIALLVVASLAIALASPLAKACEGIGPIAIGVGRCAVGSAALFALAPRATLRALAGLPARGRLQLVGVGLLLAVHFACFLGGLRATSLPAAVALVSLEPLAVVLLAWLAFRIRPTGREAIGLAVAVVGALVIAQGAGEGDNHLLGDALVVAAVVLYGIYVAAARGLQHLLPVGPYAASVYAVAALALVPLALFEARAEPGGLPHPPTATLGFIVAMGLGPTLVGHTLTQRLARRLAPSVVALIPVGETVGSIAIGAAWQRIWPTRGEWLGTALILAGAVVVSRAGAPRPPRGGTEAP